MDEVDAIILAAGRLSAQEAAQAGVRIKALAIVGHTTPLEAIITAMRSSSAVRRVIVVAPRALHESSPHVDLWLDERSSGQENVLAGLGRAQTRRSIVSASDIPFIRSEHVDDFLHRVPGDADFAYPVCDREGFLSVFPHGRTRFARVGGIDYTGGSLCLMNVALALRNAGLIRRGFAGRKSPVALASLLGAACLVRFVTGRLRIEDIERRLGELTGGRAVAIRGAHPALAMDCDSALDIDYVRGLAARDAPP